MPKLPTDAKNIEELAESLSENRQRILTIITERKWFRKTDFSLQKEVLTLPEDWDGYLVDLSKRKDEVGGLAVLKMVDFKRGDFVALTKFGVRVIATNEEVNYEYETSKYGSNPGFKGILLLEAENEIKYFVIKKSEKFAVGSLVYDSIGGMIKFKDGELVNMESKVRDEIKRQLGLSDIPVKKLLPHQ